LRSFARASLAVACAALVALGAACSSSSSDPSAGDQGDAGGGPAADSGAGSDASGSNDAAGDAAPADAGLDGKCADTFGDALTAGFGRIDGVIYAVQKPSDTACVMPNSDHLVLQVLMGGAVYRMVVNVNGSGADPRVSLAKLDHALPAPAFAEGWHLGAALDYVTTLGVHADASFSALDQDPLVAALAADLRVGDAVSVYATSGDGRPESAHLVHRNKTDEDGAIVLAPASASPKMLLFHFADQTF
jgi:hypothetical protein